MIRQVISTLHKPATRSRIVSIATRTLVVKSPGPDPLEVLRKECVNRKLCDRSGYRQPGVHWVFSIAMAPPPELGLAAPNLRTVGIQRISSSGIDFVMKKGCKASEALESEQPLSMLFTQGKYVPGQKAEQWRGEGQCVKIDLEEILHCVPHYTITGMVVSKKIEKEGLEKNDDLHSDVSVDRIALNDRSHVTELTQATRLDLENGKLSPEELSESVLALRFSPDRLERMKGGPDSILWDRWEWLRATSSEATPGGPIPWAEPKYLLPH